MPTNDDVIDLAEELYRQAREALSAVGANSSLSEPQRISRISELTQIVTRLGKLTGATVLNHRQIMGTPAWREVQDAIFGAIADQPYAKDALERMGKALRALR